MFCSDKACPLDLLGIGICELLFLCPFCVSSLKLWNAEKKPLHTCVRAIRYENEALYFFEIQIIFCPLH
jgi:hypothetical protein